MKNKDVDQPESIFDEISVMKYNPTTQRIYTEDVLINRERGTWEDAKLTQESFFLELDLLKHLQGNSLLARFHYWYGGDQVSFHPVGCIYPFSKEFLAALDKYPEENENLPEALKFAKAIVKEFGTECLDHYPTYLRDFLGEDSGWGVVIANLVEIGLMENDVEINLIKLIFKNGMSSAIFSYATDNKKLLNSDEGFEVTEYLLTLNEDQFSYVLKDARFHEKALSEELGLDEIKAIVEHSNPWQAAASRSFLCQHNYTLDERLDFLKEHENPFNDFTFHLDRLAKLFPEASLSDLLSWIPDEELLDPAAGFATMLNVHGIPPDSNEDAKRLCFSPLLPDLLPGKDPKIACFWEKIPKDLLESKLGEIADFAEAMKTDELSTTKVIEFLESIHKAEPDDLDTSLQKYQIARDNMHKSAYAAILAIYGIVQEVDEQIMETLYTNSPRP